MSDETLPLVTIGIPSYNSAAFIRPALASALAQTYGRFEVLVCDDASADETARIAEEYAARDDRVRVVCNSSNVGFAGNHNRVLEHARGEYVKMLHADDLLRPDAVARQVVALRENPGVSLVACRRDIVDEDGKRVMSRGPRWPEGVRPAADVLRRIARSGRNLLGEPTAHMFRKADALRAGGYSDGWLYVVDLEFSLRLLAEGDLYFIPEALACFRVSAGQLSVRLADEHVEDMRRLLQHVRADVLPDLTEQDVARGVATAKRDAMLRRALYSVMAVPGGHREKVAYLAGGGWNTLFAYALFAALWYVFGGSWPYWAVLSLTQFFGVLNAFAVQKWLVFRSTGPVLPELTRFASVQGAILLVNIAVFPVLVHWLGINAYLGQALFTVFVVVAGYLGNKYFSFASAEPVG